MASETVIIGCKLPSGITLEVGLQTTTKDANGQPVTSVQRGPNYERIVLKGWHAHTEAQRRSGLLLPAGMDMRPFLNRGVSKAAWDQWKAEHKGSWLLRNEILFEAKDEASAQVRVLDGEHTPTPFAPIDPKKKGAHNSLPTGVETADFARDRSA